jgi:Fic family protein
MRTVTTTWQGRPVEAAWPEPIEALNPQLEPSTIRATARAEAVLDGIGIVPGSVEVLSRLLLRAEGLSSSMIEGLRVSPAELVLAQADPGRASNDARWVADNLEVLEAVVAATGPLRIDDLLEWHAMLMRHAPGIAPDHIGAFRDRLGWVGGANPLVAAHVATPPELVAAAVADLVEFGNRSDVDPVTSAAIVHAQFETIHPFADGNGRLGRVLVARTLAIGTDRTAVPPLSAQFARDIGGYLAGLALFQAGHLDRWVRWFADAVSASAAGVRSTLDAHVALHAEWRERCADLRVDAAARALLTHLDQHAVLDSSTAAALVGVSERAARAALAQLGDRGVVASVEGHGRSRWWIASELLDLVG